MTVPEEMGRGGKAGAKPRDCGFVPERSLQLSSWGALLFPSASPHWSLVMWLAAHPFCSVLPALLPGWGQAMRLSSLT